MELTFLGTTCMVPTKERNHYAVFLKYLGEGILIDCGEGTQRQFTIAGIKITEITKILITHWHGDHTLGLPGLIQSLGASEYSKTLEIYGPPGTKEYMENLFKAFIFDNRIEIIIKDIDEGVFFENKDFFLRAHKLEHGIETLGYRFEEKDKRRINVAKMKKIGIPEGPLLGTLQKGESIEFKGKKIDPKELTYVVKGRILGIISDTVLCPACYDIAQDADVLISESSYDKSLIEKAEKHKHLTAEQAAQIASQSNTKKLILTHFSVRYRDTKVLEEEAKTIFSNTICAYDFMKNSVLRV